eukprot:3881950-Amphidinium_carterae.1
MSTAPRTPCIVPHAQSMRQIVSPRVLLSHLGCERLLSDLQNECLGRAVHRAQFPAWRSSSDVTLALLRLLHTQRSTNGIDS